MKGYTDFFGGMITSMTIPDAKGGMKYMDWDKVELICLDHPNSTIRAGLMEDWNNTSGLIFKNGKYYDGYVFGCSRWATPIVDVDGEEIECWKHSEIPLSSDKPDWWGRGQKLIDEWNEEYEDVVD